MAALLHWNLSPIGLTNSVQPYCRLAIIAMQTMPIISCKRRAQGLFNRASLMLPLFANNLSRRSMNLRVVLASTLAPYLCLPTPRLSRRQLVLVFDIANCSDTVGQANNS